MHTCTYVCMYVYMFGCNNKEALNLRMNQGDIGRIGDVIEIMEMQYLSIKFLK